MTAVAASALGLSSYKQVTRPEASNGQIELSAIDNRLRRLRTNVSWCADVFERFACGWVAMVTLTYRPGVEWSPRHISAALKACREWHRRRGLTFRYVWVAELQARGVVHYHVLVWMPVGCKLPKWDQQGWWPHGATNIKRAHSAVGYVCKYASKTDQKTGRFPHGARVSGFGGLPERTREHRVWRLAPEWLRLQTYPEMQLRPAPGGGWLSRLTGEWWPSPWRILYVSFRPGVGPVIHVAPKELSA